VNAPGATVAERIRQKLAELHPDSLEVRDDSAAHAGHAGARSGGGHYSIVIVSPDFAGHPPQRRHRMVYAALGAMMQQEIHALAIQAYAPDEI